MTDIQSIKLIRQGEIFQADFKLKKSNNFFSIIIPDFLQDQQKETSRFKGLQGANCILHALLFC